MKNKLIYAVLILVIGVMIFIQMSNQSSLAKDKIIWEYKTIYASANSGVGEFNKAGDEGWELVTIQQVNENYGYYIFKRSKK